MAQRLKGKSAVVTGGGAGGIGEEVCLALAEEGAKIVVNDVGQDSDGKSQADKVVEKIIKANGTAVANYDSVATMQGGENIIKAATSNFGRIDILVNCAATFSPKRSFELTEADWDFVLDVNLKGSFICSSVAIKEMVKQKSGRIINFSSNAATIGPLVAYAAAKAGVLGLTTSMSDDLKQDGITVNAILPSAVTKLFPFEDREGLVADNMPISPHLGPDYVAPLVAYLATDEASYITGRFLHTSGGDICIYPRPLKLPGEAHMFIRNIGKWTIDELDKVLSQLLKDKD